MDCQNCDTCLPNENAEVCDECGHKTDVPACEGYKFGPPGKAFGGWLSVLFWSHFAGIAITYLAIFFVSEAFSELGIANWINQSVITIVTLIFIFLLYKGNKGAYIAYLLLVLSAIVNLLWALIAIPEAIFNMISRLGFAIALLGYFNQSVRVREHFGTNFPTKQQKESIARILKR